MITIWSRFIRPKVSDFNTIKLVFWKILICLYLENCTKYQPSYYFSQIQGSHCHGKVMGNRKNRESWNPIFHWKRSWKSHGNQDCAGVTFEVFQVAVFAIYNIDNGCHSLPVFLCQISSLSCSILTLSWSIYGLTEAGTLKRSSTPCLQIWFWPPPFLDSAVASCQWIPLANMNYVTGGRYCGAIVLPGWWSSGCGSSVLL